MDQGILQPIWVETCNTMTLGNQHQTVFDNPLFSFGGSALMHMLNMDMEQAPRGENPAPEKFVYYDMDAGNMIQTESTTVCLNNQQQTVSIEEPFLSLREAVMTCDTFNLNIDQPILRLFYGDHQELSEQKLTEELTSTVQDRSCLMSDYSLTPSSPQITDKDVTINAERGKSFNESLMLLHEGYQEKVISNNFLMPSQTNVPTQEIGDTIDILKNVDPSQRSCDKTRMHVQISDGNQVKKLFCIYCKKLYAKLARHLEYVHKNEEEIQKLIGLPQDERKKIFTDLRNRGYTEFNSDEKINNGLLLTSRLPNEEYPEQASDYTSCAKCRAPLKKTSLNQHFRKCTKNQLKGQRSAQVLGRLFEARIHPTASFQMRMKILPVLRDDEIVRAIRFDWLVTVYGNKLCIKYTAHYQHALIRAYLRLAGRILLAVKSICPDVTDLASIFQPKFYDSVIEAIRVVGKFDVVSNEFKSPSTAAASVTQIRQIGSLLVAEYIKKENNESQLKTENFIKLLNIDAGTTINRPVNDAQAKAKRQKVERIPTTEDVKLLAEYIDREIKICFTRLSANYDYPDFVRLCQLTMASLIVFNRRRIGETQNIVVSDFSARVSIDQQMLSKLSESEKRSAKQYSKMTIRGKLGRPVPVLIKPGIEKYIERIIQHRKDAGIADENEFLFGLQAFTVNKIRVVNGCRVLRKLSTVCGAKDPETLRGTTLRKQLASICIPMELNDNSVSEVADFMGHHEKVHRDHYRKNTTFREIVYMSKLLEAAQGNDKFEDNEDDDEEEDDDGGDGTDNEEDEYDLHMTVYDRQKPENVDPVTEIVDPNPTKKRNLKRKKELPDVLVNGMGSGETIKKKVRWSEQEQTGVFSAFESYFKDKTLPPLKVINEQKKSKKYCSSLKDRTPNQIKAWISNKIKKN